MGNSLENFPQRWKAAGEYVAAIEDLPPTYKTFEECKAPFPQIFPDYCSEADVGRKLDRVSKAEEALKKFGK